MHCFVYYWYVFVTHASAKDSVPFYLSSMDKVKVGDKSAVSKEMYNLQTDVMIEEKQMILMLFI